jgi:hypothetical protein
MQVRLPKLALADSSVTAWIAPQSAPASSGKTEGMIR